jgi:hypothetical protein
MLRRLTPRITTATAQPDRRAALTARLGWSGIDSTPGLAATGAVVGLGLAAMFVIAQHRVADGSAAQLLAPAALAVGCGFFAAVRRYGLTLSLVMLYIGLIDGYVKLRTNNSQVTIVRDLLFYAIVVGVLVRSAAQGGFTRPRWTPLVVAFVLLAFAQLLNPFDDSMSAAVQGLRPHLEWVPLFFFGYALLQEPRHLRTFLVLLLAIAAANGVVSWIQSHLTPEAFASWGPGYRDRVLGKAAFENAGRVYWDATGPHPRPFGLGSDTGFGGLVGVLSLPAGLALIGTGRRRSLQILALAMTTLAAVAIITSQQRTSIVAGLIGLLAFAVYASVSGRALRTIVLLTVMAVVSYGVVHQIRVHASSDPFDRYATIAPSSLLSQTQSERGLSLNSIPDYFVKTPLGVGIGRSGPAQGLSDNTDIALRTGGVIPNSETEANYLLSELGVPGLLIVLILHVSVVCAAFVSVRRIPDLETRLLIAALAAPLVAMLAAWLSTTTTANTPLSPYFWFAAGGIAYWSRVGRRPAHPDPA